ncbi:hypothetical protein [Methylomagnum sp.]
MARTRTSARRSRKVTGSQGIAEEQFFYFFLQLRKSEIRRMVQCAQALYPDEPPERLARRLINTQCALSLIGGALLHLPQRVPMAGNALKILGFAGGTSVMSRLHLYLILEIALLYGHDIDHEARVPEMLSVLAASGLAGAVPLLVDVLDWHPAAAIPLSGLTAAAITRLVGEGALRFYRAQSEKVVETVAI